MTDIALPTTLAETPNVEPTETPKEEKTDFLSPRFAALAKKEKEIRRMQEEAKAERESFKAREEEYKTKYVPKDKLTQDPIRALIDAGFTAEQLTTLGIAIPNKQDLEFQALKDQIESLKAENKQSASKQEEASKQQYEQALNQIRKEASKLIDTNEEYETIKALGATENVVELIKDTFEADGTLLSVEEAAQKIEENLLQEAIKMASLKKVIAKLKPVEAEPDPKKSLSQALSQKSATPQPQIKTLTNAQAATSSKTLTWAERRAQAIAKLEGRAVT